MYSGKGETHYLQYSSTFIEVFLKKQEEEGCRKEANKQFLLFVFSLFPPMHTKTLLWRSPWCSGLARAAIRRCGPEQFGSQVLSAKVM